MLLEGVRGATSNREADRYSTSRDVVPVNGPDMKAVRGIPLATLVRRWGGVLIGLLFVVALVVTLTSGSKKAGTHTSHPRAAPESSLTNQPT